MQQRVPSHLERRPRGVARTLAMALLAVALPSASFAQNPTVDSLNVVPASFFSATASGNVAADGGSSITARGFVYAVTANNPDPFLGGSAVTTEVVTGGLGAYNRVISVQPNQNYSIRAYATNSNGTGYTAVQTFTAPCPSRIFPNIPPASLGTSYFAYVTALGSFGWDFYNVVAGSIPPGMGFDSWGGYLYGTPNAVGVYNFTVEVVDQFYGCVGSRAYTLEVEALHVVPRKVAFASQLVGVASLPSERRTVTIVNNGPGDVNLSLPLTASAPFAVFSSTCANPLPSTQSCDVVLTYTPPSATAHNATMSIGHDQPGSPLVVPIRGAGTASAVQQVYSSNEDSNSVTVIDPVTNAVREVVAVGNGPGGIAVLPGGAKVYVPNRYGNTVSVITTAPSHAVTATIVDGNFGYPIAAAATRGGDAVWVVSRDSDAVTIIETGTDTVLDTLYHPCVDSPRGVVANPVNHEIYVMSDATSSICVFDRVARSFIRSVYVGGFPESAVVLPNGTALYMITGNLQTALRVDIPSGSITTIPGVYGHSLDMTADGSRVYVGREGNGLAMIDTSDNSVTSIPLTGDPGAYGVAVHDAAGRVFVSDTNRVFVVDLGTNTESPSPDLPIQDPSFQGARVLATAKNAVPPGVAPTVGNLANGTPGFVATPVSADVTADGGAPIFERGFAYSTTDTTPEPNEPDVLVQPVPGAVSSMNGVLTGLTSGVTYHYQAYAKNVWGTGLSGAGSFLNQTCPSVGINEVSVPNGLQGSAYNATFTVSGTATGPFSFTYTNLAPGLSGSGNSITGTPTGGFLEEILVRATDVPTGCFVENAYTLLVGSTPAPRDLVISEFRARGVGGALDEYVEVGNRTSSRIVVLSQDGSGGWSVGTSDGVVAVIPDGTVIEKGGHWLATGANFSLWDYGAPGQLCRSWDFSSFPAICLSGADASLMADLKDDFGLAVFRTANSGSYNAGTRLDSVGGALETDPLFYEGATKLAELGTTDPLYQTAWVRRLTNMAVLSDVDDNDRDFIFVATDAGSYGPTSAVNAVLGGPNPEDTLTVRDVLNAEFPASLIEPARGPQQTPNRRVEGWSNRIEYRRVFTNNTGKDIGMLAFKVINLTTRNSRQTLAAQGDLRVIDANDADVWVDSLGQWVQTTGARLDYPGMYPLTDPWNEDTTGGVNSRLIVPFGIPQAGLSEAKSPGAKGPGACNVFADGESLPVNFRLTYASGGGYYLFVLVPQISHDILDPPAVELRTGTENLCQGGGGPRVR